MSPALYIFPCTAILLEALLLWRFARYRLWNHYPHLTLFIVFDLLSNMVLFPVRHQPEWFAEAYWRIASISLFLRFLVDWEFFRGVFPRRSALRHIAWKTLLAAEVIGVPAFLALSWSQAFSLYLVYRHLAIVIDQYFCLTQAILLLIPASVALYYRVPLGRNLRGLCVGFGIFVLVRSVDFASLQAFHGFTPYWRLLTPATFIAMIAIWLWAFWDYAPPPRRESSEERSYQEHIESQHRWNRAAAFLRRGI